jgi:hypothetical protein
VTVINPYRHNALYHEEEAEHHPSDIFGMVGTLVCATVWFAVTVLYIPAVVVLFVPCWIIEKLSPRKKGL